MSAVIATRTRPFVRITLGLVVATLLVAGCSADGDSSDDVGSGDNKPVLGACYTLSFDDLDRGYDDSQPVSCATEHSTETSLVFGVDEVDSREAALLRCMDEFPAYVGGSALVSTMQVHPLQAGTADDPEPWYRCDVFDTGGADPDGPRTLRSTRGSAKGVLGEGIPADLMVCTDTVPAQILISCTKPHRKELLAAYEPLGESGAPFPGTERLQALGSDICQDALTGRAASDNQIDAEDPALDVEMQLPDEGGWGSGGRWAGCWLVRRDAEDLPAVTDDFRLQPTPQR